MAQGGGKVEQSMCNTLINIVFPISDICLIFVFFCPTQALIPLASENTDVGKVKAGQALAKICITSNPEMAFPGERVSWHFNHKN